MSLNIIVEDNKHCTPCKTKDKKIEYQYYCTDCEAYYCEDCFELHPRVPYLAKHIVLKHDDIAVWSKLQYKCTTHDKNLEFFCGKHKVLCCHVCVSLTHRSCDGMEYILESAKNICAKDEVKLMLKRTQTEIENIQTYEKAFEKKCETNLKSKSEYVSKLEEYATKLKEMIDLRKARALKKMNEKFQENSKYSEEVMVEMKTFKTDLQDLEKQLTTATSEKEVLIFISLKRGENIIEDIEGKLSKLDISTNKENFKPKIQNKIEDYIDDIESLAVVEDEQMRQAFVSSEELNNYDFEVNKESVPEEIMRKSHTMESYLEEHLLEIANDRTFLPIITPVLEDWDSNISYPISSVEKEMNFPVIEPAYSPSEEDEDDEIKMDSVKQDDFRIFNPIKLE